MPVDAGIYGLIQQPKPVNMLAELAQAYELQGLKSKFEQEQRAQAQQNRLMSLYRDPAFLGSSVQEQATRLQGEGMFKQAGELVSTNAASMKAKRDSEIADLEMGLKKLSAIGQIMAGVKDQATHDAARQQAVQLVGEKAAANIPAVYDPAAVERNQLQAMTVKEQMEQKLKAMQYTTPTASAVLQANTSRANNADNIANSARTADMNDARSREFNATKVEENRLKREDKQDTANMTKAGQVASFDTMLGTLDRLAKHPGLGRSVGIVGAFPTIPGSDSANFQAELETFKSQAFVPMVAQLKGMGALSDAEGRKLTAAVGALDPKMGEQAFRESISRIMADMKAARARVVGTRDAGAANAPTGSGRKLPGTRTVDVGGTQMQARQAPDGKYYVQQGGKWFEVKE